MAYDGATENARVTTPQANPIYRRPGTCGRVRLRQDSTSTQIDSEVELGPLLARGCKFHFRPKCPKLEAEQVFKPLTAPNIYACSNAPTRTPRPVFPSRQELAIPPVLDTSIPDAAPTAVRTSAPSPAGNTVTVPIPASDRNAVFSERGSRPGRRCGIDSTSTPSFGLGDEPSGLVGAAIHCRLLSNSLIVGLWPTLRAAMNFASGATPIVVP